VGTSFAQAEGIPVSPYSVRKALENTSGPVGELPADKLSTGQGLMQVDRLDFLPRHLFLYNCHL
jgi:tripeptidyl-peptidase-2